MVASTTEPADEAEMRAFIERDVDLAGGYFSATNHGALNIRDVWRDRLHKMKAPVLVIHGTADPVYPVEYAVALSQALASGKLVLPVGGGHGLHRTDWDTIIDAIVEHTSPKVTTHDT